jgi:hypothetical protein
LRRWFHLYAALEECQATEHADKKDAFDAAMLGVSGGDPDRARKIKAAIQKRYWQRSSAALKRLGQPPTPNLPGF